MNLYRGLTSDAGLSSISVMASAMQNPFRPGRAVAPRFLMGREAVRERCQELLEALITPGYGPPRDIVVFGPRGNGKTSLLVNAGFPVWVRELVASEGSEPPFRHIHIDSGLDVATELGTRSAEVAQRLKREGATGKQRSLLHRFGGLGACLGLTLEGGFQVQVNRQAEESRVPLDYQGHLSLKQQLQLLLLEGPVLLTIDEAYGMERDFAARLLSSVGSLCSASEGDPETAPPSILLVLAGTSELRRWLASLRTPNAPHFGATFVARSEMIGLGCLSPEASAQALTKPLASVGMSIGEATLEVAVEQAQCYPFFLQHLGSEMFKAAQAQGMARVTDTHLEVAVSVLDRIREDYYGERRAELEQRGLVVIATRIGESLLRAPARTLSSAATQTRIEEILREVLGSDRDAWEMLSDGLGLHAAQSDSLALFHKRLARCMEGEPGGFVASRSLFKAASLAIAEQLRDVGFLWVPITEGEVELGIPSLAAYLLEREARASAVAAGDAGGRDAEPDPPEPKGR